ncbi:MAG TPA: LLM class F420-dependent oxidoreductase [Iamia sp.]|nr:LLM class F420-dependent oxidoreductase [Iamia sp.]
MADEQRRTVKFGAMVVYAGLSDPEFLAGLGAVAEDLGFDSLWLADHVVVPSIYDSVYPYSPDGKLDVDPSVPFAEPLVSLGYLAASTTVLELGVAVLIVPQRNPVLLAKQAATLDRLAGGRLRLGVGVGWLREEFAALGVPFEHRGARTDANLDVMRALWSGEEVRCDGPFVQLDGITVRPTPTRASGVPIIVGGHSNAAADRAGRRGDGFFPFCFSTDELAPLYERARATAVAEGRAPDELELLAPSTTEPDWVARVADLGVSHVIMPSSSPSMTLEGAKERLGRFSERVIARAR